MTEFWTSWLALGADAIIDEQEASSSALSERSSSLRHDESTTRRTGSMQRTSSLARSTSLARSKSLKRTGSREMSRGNSSLSRLLLRRHSSSTQLLDRFRTEWFGSTPRRAAAPAAPGPPKAPLSQRMMDQLVAQLVPADVLKVVTTVQSEIFGAQMHPPEAALRFALREARGPLWNWAKDNANTVFLGAGAAVAVCCGIVHTVKALMKAAARQLRFRRLTPAPLVTFACDGMLPTGFAGPFLACYVAVKVLLHAQQMAEALRQRGHSLEPAAVTVVPNASSPRSASASAELAHMEDPVYARHDTARTAGSPIPNAAEALGGLIEGALAAAMQRQAAANARNNYSSAQLTPQLGAGGQGHYVLPPRSALPAVTPTASPGTSALGGGEEEEEPGSPWATGGANSAKAEAKSSNRKLSSRYRGVCWNKKNKRWQSAINSGGRYLYLGSYTNEDDAARAFDKAAIKIRGRKAKLNFIYDDYTDENGDFIDDIILPDPPAPKASKRKGFGRADASEQLQLLAGQLTGHNRLVTDGDGSGGSSGGRAGRYGAGGHGVYGESLGNAFRGAAAMLQPVRHGGHDASVGAAFGAQLGGAAGRGGARGYFQEGGLLSQLGLGGYGQQGQQQQQQQGQYDAPLLLSGQAQAAQVNLAEVARQLPAGCTIDDVLPGNEAMFGIIYKQESCGHAGARGCAVWNGAALNDDGMYGSEREARQGCASALSVLLGRDSGHAPWQQQQQQQPPQPTPQRERRRTAIDGLANISIAEALALAAKAAAEQAGLASQALNPADGSAVSDGAGPSSVGPEGDDVADGRVGRGYGSGYDEEAAVMPDRYSFKRRSGSRDLDSGLGGAPAAKRTRVGSMDGSVNVDGSGELAGVPPLGPTATAALQGRAGSGAGSGGNAFSAVERLCNLNLSDMLRQMAQAAAARGSNAAASALGEGLAAQQQQPALST